MKQLTVVTLEGRMPLYPLTQIEAQLPSFFFLFCGDYIVFFGFGPCPRCRDPFQQRMGRAASRRLAGLPTFGDIARMTVFSTFLPRFQDCSHHLILFVMSNFQLFSISSRGSIASCPLHLILTSKHSNPFFYHRANLVPFLLCLPVLEDDEQPTV